MSQYRTPLPPHETDGRHARRALTLALGAAFAAALGVVIVLDARATRRAREIEAQRAALQRAEEENARRLRDLRGSDFGDGQTRRALETRVAPASRDLPRCRCAPGDPLCSEIPGQTCAP